MRLIPIFISITSTGRGARLSRTVLMSTSIVALGAVGALAQEAAPVPVTAAEPPASVLRLDPVTVTATRGERPVDEVPGTVSVITDSEIDRRLVSDPRDLLRYEPGVSIGSDPTRSGLTNYTIRGIGGNRVLVQVDGARLPDFPATSPTFNRDYVDLDTVKRVEIVRGPASSLYGSDAIGGVVAYITKDPADYLTEFGRDVFVSAKAGYDGADNSLATTATVAGRAGSLEEQALGPVQNPREMNQTLEGMVRTLEADPDYPPLFARAFPEDPRITPVTVAKALATFERTLVSGVTPFDRWVGGDGGAVSDEAKRGFEVFTGPAGCSSCHSGWQFTDHAFHDIGLPGEDLGRGAILGLPELNHAFKTPPLRNVADRAPYMHDGSIGTLEGVVEHYRSGIVGRDTLSPDLPRIDALSEREKADLVAFLHSLSPDPATAADSLAVTSAPESETSDTLTIVQKDKRFSHRHVHIKVGETLTIQNQDTRAHNIRVFEDSMDFNSGYQEPGEHVSLPFTEPGTYHVFCGIHPKMKLKVDVE